MKNFLIIFGTLIIVIGLITSIIAARFDKLDTTAFSKFCYEFEHFCNVLVLIGTILVSISLFV